MNVPIKRILLLLFSVSFLLGQTKVDETSVADETKRIVMKDGTIIADYRGHISFGFSLSEGFNTKLGFTTMSGEIVALDEIDYLIKKDGSMITDEKIKKQGKLLSIIPNFLCGGLILLVIVLS